MLISKRFRHHNFKAFFFTEKRFHENSLFKAIERDTSLVSAVITLAEAVALEVDIVQSTIVLDLLDLIWG